jgi:tetratricopeptide (TPR) repeat protein
MVVDYLLEVPKWRGRDELVASLRSSLFDDFSDAAEKPKVIALIGQGGIGKSSLVVKLLESIGVNWRGQKLAEYCPYDGVICLKTLPGTSFDDVAGQLLSFLGDEQQSLNKPEQKIAAILKGLQQGVYLVVMDNLESILQSAIAEDVGRAISPEMGELLNQLVAVPHQSQVLLTSRESVKDLADKRSSDAVVNSSLVRVVDVEGISIEAGVKLLQDYGLKDSEDDLRWVSERVGGNALLLELLAGLAKNKPGFLRRNPQLATKNAKKVMQEQLARQTEKGRELLKRMCVLRVGIDVQGLNFLRLYQQETKKFEDLFEAADFLEYYGMRRAKEAEMARQIPATQAIVDQLSACSLLRNRYDEAKGEDLYDLHQLIAEYLQTEFESELPDLLQRVYSFYRAGKNVSSPKTLEDLQPLLESQHFAFQLGNYNEAVNLTHQLDEYLKPWGYWTQLHDLTLQILPHAQGINYRICCQILGDIHRDWGDWDQSQQYFQRSLSHAQENNDRAGIASCYGSLGGIERNRGDWAAAESFYNKSLSIFKELGDQVGIANSYGLLGDIERTRGNWAAAESLYNQSIEIKKELGYRRDGIANYYVALGCIERNRGNWDTAESLYNQSLSIFNELGDQVGIANSYGLLGGIERNRENWAAAESLCNQSLSIFKELGDRVGIADVISELGRTELGRGNLEKAESFLQDALQQMESIGMKYEIAEVKWDLARLELRKSKQTLAEQYYQTAHQIFSELGAAKDLERIEREWSALHPQI